MAYLEEMVSMVHTGRSLNPGVATAGALISDDVDNNELGPPAQ